MVYGVFRRSPLFLISPFERCLIGYPRITVPLGSRPRIVQADQARRNRQGLEQPGGNGFASSCVQKLLTTVFRLGYRVQGGGMRFLSRGARRWRRRFIVDSISCLFLTLHSILQAESDLFSFEVFQKKWSSALGDLIPIQLRACSAYLFPFRSSWRSPKACETTCSLI